MRCTNQVENLECRVHVPAAIVGKLLTRQNELGGHEGLDLCGDVKASSMSGCIEHTGLGRTQDLHQLANDGLDVALQIMSKKG
jgi:hypothetical protein